MHGVAIDGKRHLGDGARMNRLPGLILLLIALFSGTFATAQVARDTTIEVSATVQESPPKITLSWVAASYPVTLQKLFRKAKGAPAWTDIATLAISDTSYVDSAVAVGVSYEYFVFRISSTTDPGSAAGYVNAGIRIPLVAARGRVILLVDATMAAPLATELTRFAEDLVGDGWTVLRQDVPRTGTVAATKTIIQTLYNADPANTRSLILFGHIPVPYSGDLNPDGHPEHRGAWAADVYYGEMNGTWTDSTVNNPNGSRTETQNIPGDGKFDQSGLPSSVELEVGRIDLANLPDASAGASETELLRQYLNRDHAFRHKAGNYSNVVRRGLITDAFGFFGGEAFAASGWRNFTSFFGSAAGAIVQQPWLSTLENDSYLWAYGCGSGSYGGAAFVAGTHDYGMTRSLSVFNMLFGSYFGDWDIRNSFLRAPLAGRPDSLGLASMWAGRPHWHLYHMALGETLGYGARTTQNNAGFATGGYVLNVAGRGVHIALMGDPTLRLHPVLPVTNLVVDSSSGMPSLTWTASADSNIEGYTVLRAGSAAGPFDSIGGALVAGTSFVDRTGTPGQSYNYQVRAVKLETSASGTYLNNSQGVFDSGSFAGPVNREIQVTGNNRPIPSGDTLAGIATGTDFGSAEAGVQTVTHTFTIANDGTGLLSLTGSPVVQMSGPGAGDFSVTAQPANSIAGSGSVTFQIVFTPTVVGARSATVSIANDDSDEGSYQFAIAGTGLTQSPEISLSPASIASTLAPNASTTVPVTIGNTGAGALHHTIANSQSAYSFRDSNSFGGPGYAWIEIGPTGTEVAGFNNPDDAMSAAIPIGFSFPLFDANFTSLYVCTNGFITFNNANPLFFGTSLPSIEAPGNIIAAFWNDLILDGSSHIYTQQIGDLFVIQYENIPRFGVPTARATFEIVLRQTGEIYFQYKQVPAAITDYAVGIQDAKRTEGLQVAFDTAYAQAQMAVRILPSGFHSWLGSSANGGAVAPGGSQGFNAMLNSTGLSPGYYFAQLNVVSDDADESRLSVPVQLTVSGPEVETLGNGLGIASGDTSPAVIDGTDLGMAAIAGGSVARTFTIRNSGSDPLTLSAAGVTGSGFSVTTPPAASVAALGSTTLVVTFAPTVAGAANGTVTFTTNDTTEGSYAFAVSGLALSPAESWRLSHFGGIANTGNAADTADPDGDGLRNTLEYAFSLDPQLPNLAGIPTARVNMSGYLEIQFTRNTGNTDLTYTVQASSNLVTWTPIASSAAGAATAASGAHSVSESGGGTIKTVTVEDSQPMSAGNARFLRVSVTRN